MDLTKKRCRLSKRAETGDKCFAWLLSYVIRMNKWFHWPDLWQVWTASACRFMTMLSRLPFNDHSQSYWNPKHFETLSTLKKTFCQKVHFTVFEETESKVKGYSILETDTKNGVKNWAVMRKNWKKKCCIFFNYFSTLKFSVISSDEEILENFFLSNSWYFAAKPQQRGAKRAGAFSKRYNNLFHPKSVSRTAYLEKQRAHGTRVVALSFACSFSRVSPTRLLWKLAPRLVQLVIIVNENWLKGDFTILAQHHNPTSAP